MNALARFLTLLTLIVGGAVLLGYTPWVVVVGLCTVLLVWAFRAPKEDR